MDKKFGCKSHPAAPHAQNVQESEIKGRYVCECESWSEPADQRTEAWFADRLGKVSASMVHAVMARTKTGYSATRQSYMDQLVVERITGQREESYQSQAMAFGTEQEPFARAMLETRRGIMVEEVGFIPHPTIPNCGASPDGLVGDDYCVEIKVPGNTAFFNFLLAQAAEPNNPKAGIDAKYYAQIQLQLACTQRSRCLFVMFNPRLEERNQMAIATVERDDAFIAEMESEIIKFLAELDARTESLKSILVGP